MTSPASSVILLVAFILMRIVSFFVNRMRRLADSHGEKPERAAELRTLASIARATAFGIIGFMVLLDVLKVFNIPATSLLASAGLVGVGIGLGAQSLFKDIINGIFILIENQFNVGDTVKIASLTGTVEDLTLRLTTLRDGDGTLYFIPNSQIATVSNLSRDFAVATALAHRGCIGRSRPGAQGSAGNRAGGAQRAGVQERRRCRPKRARSRRNRRPRVHLPGHHACPRQPERRDSARTPPSHPAGV